jgi:hypothetical protein
MGPEIRDWVPSSLATGAGTDVSPPLPLRWRSHAGGGLLAGLVDGEVAGGRSVWLVRPTLQYVGQGGIVSSIVPAGLKQCV